MTTLNGSSPNSIPPPYAPKFSRVSSFRSPEFEVLVYSPHVNVEPISFSWPTSKTIPVYGVHDSVGGKIIIDPSCRSGRLVVTISGAFSTQRDPEKFVPNRRLAKQKQIFLLASTVMHVAALDSDASRKSIFTGRSRNSRAPSSLSLFEQETRTFPFKFDLGQSQKSGEILPATVTSSGSKSSAIEVSYQLTVSWEPLKLTQQPSLLTIPVVVQVDSDFHSLDGRPDSQDSWIEIPLRSPRPIPVKCAVTLPSSLTFSRTSSIPFFVVFTTTPRSPNLAREIAADASISVSISSHICVTESTAIPTASAAESVLSDRSSESRSSRFKTKMIRRLRSSASVASYQSAESHNPLPVSSPRPAFFDIQTVYKGISIGFPKRPRHRASDQKTYPSLEEHRSLPDGLYKDKIPLNREILASINWGGISVKYFFEVSVLVGQDELRAKILLQII
ncbi:hypothetical protein C8F04DRAFT_658057 [Mycena alexandri]|uniref:Uncharacterized protein n=1 Tax=Mycena alexandri TaxID=1745969 RepID=A0AAD6SQY1_9AGAR|nr:hypothetical protein C8F04DRAFT_658057 [Mycena alexandri]